MPKTNVNVVKDSKRICRMNDKIVVSEFVLKWVEDLAKQQYVENLIKRQTNNIIRFEHHDLAQQIYLDLLKKPEDKVRQIVQDKLVENFINRMIKLQLRSNTSEFYRRYRDFSRRYTDNYPSSY